MRQNLTTSANSRENDLRADRILRNLLESKKTDKVRLKTQRRLLRNLSATFNTIWPELDPDLTGTVIALLLDIFDYSDRIKDDIQRLATLRRPRDAQTLRSFVQDLLILNLQHQGRYIAELRRDLPKLMRRARDAKVRQSEKRGEIDQIAGELQQSREES